MADSIFFGRKDSKYGEGVLLDEYNGLWSLVSAKEGKDGKVYMEWCFPQKRDGSKQPLEKSLPWKISFGSREEMVSTLRKILYKLDRGPEGTNPGDKTPDGDKIPF